LPQHEIAEALFSRRTNDKVRIRLSNRVQVLADELRGEELGEGVECAALVRMFLDNAPHRIGDFIPSAVANRKIDVQAAIARRSGCSFDELRDERLR
jgi:hypothetical protein